MKKVFLALLLAFLFFGCIQLPGTINKEKIDSISNVTKEISETITVEEKCSPAYSVVIPQKAKLGDLGTVKVKADCAYGATIAVYFDGVKIDEKKVSGKSAELIFNLNFRQDGTKTVEVIANGSLIKKDNIIVDLLGNNETSGSKNDGFSVKEYIASGFEIKSDIEVRSIGIYVKRLYSNTLKNSYVVVEIRKDDNGVPASSSVAATYLPIEKIMMNEKWVWFNFKDSVRLAPGTYWVVLRVDQENPNIVSDVANIHYIGDNPDKPASELVKRMVLKWNDQKQKHEETTWEPAAYDRIYSILLSSETH
ncbi:MAG: hypothetical protein QXF70_01510 [Candidatus Bilamarchaeaceae archaeon]